MIRMSRTERVYRAPAGAGAPPRTASVAGVVLLLVLSVGLLGITDSLTAQASPAEPPAPAGSPPQEPPVTVAPPKAQPAISASRVAAALDRGCNWLIDHQNPDGGYGSHASDAGITGLVVKALADSPRRYREDDGPSISAAVAYLLARRHPDGSIYDAGQGLWNYKTSMAVLALTALDAGRKSPRHASVIAQARDFIAGLQCAEDARPLPYDRDVNKRSYGGIGYGSDRSPDLSNTQFALEALHAAGLSEDSDVLARVQVFLQRCQNLPANDALDGETFVPTGDGGFIYAPGESKAGTVDVAAGLGLRSYGSMTYAGIKSYIYAGLDRNDPRVQAAWDWIRAHFTLAENPGMAHLDEPTRGQMGLYYYFLMMARTFQVLEVDQFETPTGRTVEWAQELAARLLELQRADGSWTNPVDRWMEGDPAVVTAYAVWTLGIVHARLERRATATEAPRSP